MSVRYRALSALLAILMLSASFAACGDSPAAAPSQTAAPDAGDAGEVETTEAPETSILDGLDFNGADFRVSMSDTDISSAEFLVGPEEQTGDIVNDAVFQRNMDVEERLNIKFKYTTTDVAWSSVADYVRKLVLSGSDDFDLIVNDQRGMSTDAVEKLLRKAEDCAYFDFTTAGWWVSYMDDLSIKSGETYLLVGDYFMDVLRRSHLLYYNRSMYENMYGDPDAIYAEVLDHKWTYDSLAKKIENTYIDLDGDGKVSKDDQYGLIIGGVGGSIFPWVYGTDCRTYSRDEEGYPQLDFDLDRAQKLYEKTYACFYSDGTSTKFGENAKDLHEKFISGTALFISTAEIAQFENFRSMEDDIGLVPYPLLDESQKDYHTVVHDTAEVGAIPLTAANYDMSSAVVQALNEATAASVTPTYYETALKIKYVRDDYSAQMIDIIHDGISGLFTLIYGGAWANDIFSWAFLQPLQKKGDSISSEYEKRYSQAVAGLEKLRETYDSAE